MSTDSVGVLAYFTLGGAFYVLTLRDVILFFTLRGVVVMLNFFANISSLCLCVGDISNVPFIFFL